MNGLTCPRCAQVDQVQSVQSIYTTQSGIHHSSGLAVGGVLAGGPMVARVTSTGTQASHLALRLAPPPEPRRRSAFGCGAWLGLVLLVCFGLIGLIGASVASGPDAAKDRLVGYLAGIISLCLVPVVIFVTIRRERALKREYQSYAAVWPAMTQVWQTAMACLRCHGVFFPPGTPLTAMVGGTQLLPIDDFQNAVTDLGTRLVLAPAIPAEPKPLTPPAPES
jgi:hypothetical protein